jgi:hypothetical protein
MAGSNHNLDRYIAVLLKRDEERNGPRRVHGRARFVATPTPPLSAELTEVLARMQTPASRARIDAAFEATPDELADAAVAVAKRKRG